MLLLDCKTITGPDNTALSGDMAARILDLAGVVVNRQTIPGDRSALRPSGIRLGTTWVTQRGMGEVEIDALGDIIADVLNACIPFSLTGRVRPLPRAKVNFDVLQSAAARSRELAASIGIDTDAQADGYPHFYAGDPRSPHQPPPKSPPSKLGGDSSLPFPSSLGKGPGDGVSGRESSSPLQLSITGAAAGDFLHIATTSDVMRLNDGERQPTHILEKDGAVMASGEVTRKSPTEFQLTIAGLTDRAIAWLRALSDGFVLFDDSDIHAKLPGPVAVTLIGEAESIALAPGDGYDPKAYHIGINGENLAMPTASHARTSHQPPPNSPPTASVYAAQAMEGDFVESTADDLSVSLVAPALPDASGRGPGGGVGLLQTPLHSLHLELGAKMAPFAGYDMPLWYKSVGEEHRAVREDAGIFDVAHMGVFGLRGRGAAAFLDLVATNDVKRLNVGDSHYSFLLDVNGIPLDDLMIYRLADEHFLAVVNASNNDKNWAWLQAVIAGDVMIDGQYPSRRIEGRVDTGPPGTSRFDLRDLRRPEHGAERRVDIALQGPMSRDYLLALGGEESDLTAVKRLKWAGVARVALGGFDLIVSRTGYTGERVAYELFVHPERAAALFRRLVDMGVAPCGLAARDSLRTEAGLPLYGLELAGDLNLNPAEAGFGAYVKLYKPFFIGKRAFIEREGKRKGQVSRFRLDSKGARPAHYGDPIVNARGRVVGTVTSCNIDSEGYQLGQALMERGRAATDPSGFRKPGTQLAVFASAGRLKAVDYAELAIGARAPVPQPLTILTRFPRRK